MKKRVVLAGGGHAHLSVLLALRKNRPGDIDVVLITPSRHQNYSGMLPGWIAGLYSQAECRIDLYPLARSAGVRMLFEQIVGLDTTRRCILLSNGSHIDYDLLSLDVGSETDTSWLGILGNKLLPVKPLDKFFTRWPQILASAKEKRNYKLLVVGAGAAGVEIALATQLAFTRAGMDGRVDLVASESGLLPGHAKAVQERVQRFVKHAGVALHCLRGVGTEEGVLLADGQLLKADHVIATTGARAPVWLETSGLELDDQGYILVDMYHRSVSHANVFAAGDVCARMDVLLSRSGVHAVRAGPVLGKNLLAVLRDRPLRPYRPRTRSLYLLACGQRDAVASWGRWSAEGRWVWYLKNWIDRRFIQRFSVVSSRQE